MSTGLNRLSQVTTDDLVAAEGNYYLEPLFNPADIEAIVRRRTSKRCGGDGSIDRVYFIHKNDVDYLNEEIIEIPCEVIEPKALPPREG